MHKRPAFASQKERPAKAGRLIVRHAHDERAAWQSRADDCDLCLSEFIRCAANAAAGLQSQPRKKAIRGNPDAAAIAYALLKIGTNINQQTHALNTLMLAGDAPDPALSASITRTHAELADILAKLKNADA